MGAGRHHAASPGRSRPLFLLGKQAASPSPAARTGLFAEHRSEGQGEVTGPLSGVVCSLPGRRRVRKRSQHSGGSALAVAFSLEH